MQRERDDDIALGRKVYVGNLDPDVSSDELDEIFRRYGKLINIWVARNPPGFAFVTFDDARDARDAVEATDGIRHRDKYIRVEIAKGPGASSRGGRGRGGGSMRSPPVGSRRGYGGDYRDRGYDDRGDSWERRDRRDGGAYRGYSGQRRGRSRSRSVSRRRSYSPGQRNSSMEPRAEVVGRRP